MQLGRLPMQPAVDVERLDAVPVGQQLRQQDRAIEPAAEQHRHGRMLTGLGSRDRTRARRANVGDCCHGWLL